MALRYVTRNGSLLIRPDSSVAVQVVNRPGNVAAAGFLALVGEAAEGPSYAQDRADENLKPSELFFGPGDLSNVVAKYGSGPLVDAFLNAVSASADPQIPGTISQIYLIKTNNSTKASRTTKDAHGVFNAIRGGELGNDIKETITTTQAEAAPTTSPFSYVPSASAANMAFRINGGAEQTQAVSADTAPAALASALTALDNINVVGGVDRGIISGLNGVTISLTASVQDVTIGLATPNVFAGLPTAGDTLRIPAGSVIGGGGAENVGWYLVTSVTNVDTGASIVATKVTAGPPATVASAVISATPADDLLGYSSMQFDNMSGTARDTLTGLVGQDITVTVAGSALTATLAAGQVFDSDPVVDDIVLIPSGSAFQGTSNLNRGWYQVTAVSNTTSSAFITMSRLSNGDPEAVAATAIAAVTDIQVFDPQIKGVGKSLEVYDNAGAVNVSTIFKDLGVDSPADWLEALLVSADELEKTFDIVRDVDNISEQYVVGGIVALRLGYNGTTASATISESNGTITLTTTVTGGSGGNLSINLSKISTISDLVTKINAETGYVAASGSTLQGQRSPGVLDQMTLDICSELGNAPGRIKSDLWDLTVGDAGLANSILIEYAATATAGLPQDNVALFLSGGARGATTGAQFVSAIDALQNTPVRMVVPLVSQDASADILEGLTDSASTYSVDAVNAAVRSHVLSMSTEKLKKHRLAVCSKKGTFAEAKDAAQDLASARVACTFQDIQALNINGEISQEQPWMGAVKAGAMQLAAFNRSIFNKLVNINGALQAADDFDDQNVTHVEDALINGLLVIAEQSTGGWSFVSDGMTYGTDQNFVFNSMMSGYIADTVALDLAQSLKAAFVGQSVAEVTVEGVVSFMKTKFTQYLDSRLLVGTESNPNGWQNIEVNIDRNVLSVKAFVLVASAIYFVPIDLTIDGITSSASA